MTDSNVTKELEKKLLSFITEEDPMLSMLQWIEYPHALTPSFAYSAPPAAV